MGVVSESRGGRTGVGYQYGVSQSGGGGANFLGDLFQRNPSSSSGGGGGRGVASGLGTVNPPITEAEQASLDQRRYEADLGFKNSQADRDFKNNRLNQIMGYLNNFGQNAGLATAGGQSGGGPRIDARPVFDGQQTQQAVNAIRAKNDASAQSQSRLLRDQTANGYGGNSPLALALQQGVRASNVARNADAERDIRLGAAEKNAGQLLSGQQAQEEQYASRMDEDIRRRQPYWNMQNSLIQAFAGLA